MRRDSQHLAWGALLVATLLAGPILAQPALAGEVSPPERPAKRKPAVEVSGWTQVSYTASSCARESRPAGFNDRADEVLLQQNWLRIERAPDKGGAASDLGFRLDTILPGTDYRFTRARGLLEGQSGLYGIDPIGFSLNAWFPKVANGLDLQVGRFPALFGIETSDAIRNAQLSHSYAFIYDPFTHCGAVATVSTDKDTALQGGIVTGSDLSFADGARPTVIGSIKLGEQDVDDTALLSWVLGPGRFDAERGLNHPNLIDLTYVTRTGRPLVYGFEGLYGWQRDVPTCGDVDWYSLAHYLTYTPKGRWSGSLRFELFGDSQGQRTGFAGQYRALTLATACRLSGRTVLRTEIRRDINRESSPFEGQEAVTLLSLDLIQRW